MRKLVLLYCALILPIAAAPEAKREVVYTGEITPANCVPTFDNGYLAAYELGGAALVYAPDGSLAFRFLPPREHAFVVNVAVDADGVAAFAVEGPPERGAISITERTGYIGRVRNLASSLARLYAAQRQDLGYPLLAAQEK